VLDGAEEEGRAVSVCEIICDCEDLHSVVIDYTNHRGERGLRRVVPVCMMWGSTKWHPTPQVLLRAFDLDKGSHRDFATSGIHDWRRSET
jgi:predicted DNA-binding transcriptional regulator YafY